MFTNSLKFQNQSSLSLFMRPKIMLSIPSPLSSRRARRLILLAALSSLAIMQSVHAETFYKWVDKDGSTHYTQTPPGKNGVKSAKKVYIDDLAPPVPLAPVNAENSSGNAANGNQNNNPVSRMNSDQLASTANNASVPTTGQKIPQSNPQPMITPIIPPPANRLIVPTQDQTRPAFSER